MNLFLEQLLGIAQYYPVVLKGIGVTLALSFIGIVAGGIAGFLLGMGRAGAHKPLRFVIGAYTDIFRGTPVLVQVFVVFFIFPEAGIEFDSFTCRCRSTLQYHRLLYFGNCCVRHPGGTPWTAGGSGICRPHPLSANETGRAAASHQDDRPFPRGAVRSPGQGFVGCLGDWAFRSHTVGLGDRAKHSQWLSRLFRCGNWIFLDLLPATPFVSPTGEALTFHHQRPAYQALHCH
ncbi:ABC transporter permease subunit [Polaromonas sp. P1(28)-8]|nr:ABC transporter permease subunit [Polaromonas sp. P1(28)-8]